MDAETAPVRCTTVNNLAGTRKPFDLTGREHPAWTGLPELVNTAIKLFAHINNVLQESMMHKHGCMCYKNALGWLHSAQPHQPLNHIAGDQQITLDLIRKGKETWVYTTYSFAQVPLSYQFLRMVTNAAGLDAASNMTDEQRKSKDGAAAVDDDRNRDREQEDDENVDVRVTFSNRPITNEVTIANHDMHRPDEPESLSLYDFQSLPDDDANDSNAPRAKRGRHAEPQHKFRGTHPAVNKLIVAMRATKSSDFGSTESRAMISMILFKPFRATNEVVPAHGETWSQTLDLFKNKLEQGSDRLWWINNFRAYVNTSPGKLIANS
ncbi:hypothetical protein H9P43_008857 [Blastocladiella emersonii ATCC 22665]|nr:hypothetical protein H9P43_008857 [Blastocladiella emersonii ATCC 22665]